MHTGNEGVGGNRQLLPERNSQQGAVITDPKGNALAALRTRRGGEEIADQLKLTHSDYKRQSALERLHFSFTQTRGQLVEYAVDELVAVGGTEDLRQLDTFVDHNAVRHVDTLEQFPGG